MSPKPAQNSKTLWVNVAVVAVAGLTGMLGTEVVANNPELVTYFTMLVGGVNVFLRFVTNSPVYLGKV